MICQPKNSDGSPRQIQKKKKKKKKIGSVFPISIFGCQAAVKKLMLTCPGLNFARFIFSCLSALTNPDVYLLWAKFYSSLVNVKICHILESYNKL